MGTNIPNLRHLRAFCEVARSSGITQASKRIYLSQPAITQAIARLEQQLQTRLFERRSNGMRPTAAGSLFLVRIERALAHLRSGAREAARSGLRKVTQRGHAGSSAHRHPLAASRGARP